MLTMKVTNCWGIGGNDLDATVWCVICLSSLFTIVVADAI